MLLNICGFIDEDAYANEIAINVHKFSRLSFEKADLIYAPALAANTELLDQSKVCLAVAVGNVLEKSATLANKAEQTTAGGQVLAMHL